MKKPIDAESYVNEHQIFSEGLTLLRSILLGNELVETIKWSIPVYTMGNKNIVGLCGFKHKFGLWFYQGCFLSDPAGILVNAQEGKTKGMRHVYFTKAKDIDKKLMKAYIKEAIENHHAGKTIKPKRKEAKVPSILKTAFEADATFRRRFEELRVAQQADYIEHINSAKQESTKLRRIEKMKPLVMTGKGLNDKYK